MIGVFVNTAAVLVGGTVGLLLKKGIPERISDIVMKALALCVIYVGIDGMLNGEKTLVLILSMVLGTVIGELCRLDDLINKLGNRLESRFKRTDGKTSIAEGFVTASLLFCVGAMTIVGSLQAGISGDNTMLYTKSTLDLISSCIFAASLGAGVLFSAAFVLVFQGSIVLLASVLAPLLTDTVVAEMTCAGSLMIIAIGLNMLGATKLKVMNMMPAMLLPVGLCMFM